MSYEEEQKNIDIYDKAIDYEVNATAMRRFFSTLKNILHWAVYGHTAAESIYKRADAIKKYIEFNQL